MNDRESKYGRILRLTLYERPHYLGVGDGDYVVSRETRLVSIISHQSDGEAEDRSADEGV